MNTIEGNKIIAEFLEWEMIDEEGRIAVPNLYPFTVTTKDKRSTGWTSCFADELEFHTSWDWQIPVWSKVTYAIRKLAYGDNQKTDFYLHLLNEYEGCVFQNNPKRGHEVLIKAIQWYTTHH